MVPSWWKSAFLGRASRDASDSPFLSCRWLLAAGKELGLLGWGRDATVGKKPREEERRKHKISDFAF